MVRMHIKNSDIFLLRKIMSVICIIVPWEFYFYNGLYSTGWGIKFSLFYINFDIVYGTLVVNVVKQLSMLSYGGVAPSFRTISWFFGALLCLLVLINENFKECLSQTFSVHTSGYLLILCSIFNVLGSLVVWNSSFKAMPIGFVFLLFAAYLYFPLNLSPQSMSTKSKEHFTQLSPESTEAYSQFVPSFKSEDVLQNHNRGISNNSANKLNTKNRSVLSSIGASILGLTLGGIVGFLLRPSVPLIGQLPFETVVTRGTNLKGLGSLIVPYAETSFNYLLAGALIGACIFWLISRK